MSRVRSVELSDRAERALLAVDAKFLDPIKAAIRELSVNPLLGKKLKGEFEGLRSYRVGSFRILYRFVPDVVQIAYIDHRKDVYR